MVWCASASAPLADLLAHLRLCCLFWLLWLLWLVIMCIATPVYNSGNSVKTISFHFLVLLPIETLNLSNNNLSALPGYTPPSSPSCISCPFLALLRPHNSGVCRVL